MLTDLDKKLLAEIADLHKIPECSINIRKNGKCELRQTNEDINIVSKTDKSGIDIFVRDGVKGKSCHIPVILSVAGLTDVVYNDFYIGNNVEVTIIAGCGISCSGNGKSEHNGIHRFFIGENSKVLYVEKHLGIGDKVAERNLNPTTEVTVGNGSEFTMKTTQLGGVNNAKRNTIATLKENATLIINEVIYTTDKQQCSTNFKVNLVGKNSKVDVVSRSVAKDFSKQAFNSNVIGKNECFGHVECDGILTDHAKISSTPKIDAQNVDALLVHEAMIGKISSDQIIKLMSLGLSKEEAEQEIINGFLNNAI